MNLSVKNAAQLLAVSEKTIYRWIKQNILPAFKVNECYRFNRAELLEWATSKRLGIAPEAYLEPEQDTLPLPSLSEALKAGGIIYRLEGKTRNTALESLVMQLRLPEEFDRNYLLRMLIAREELGSTAIGDGIALPHFRSPGLIDLSQPSLTLAFLENPIEYGALDGQSVGILFLPFSTTLRGHLHLLRHLAHALRNAEVQKALHQQQGREDILQAMNRVVISDQAASPATIAASSARRQPPCP